MLKRKCYWYLKCITVSIEILIHSDSDSCWFVVFYVGIHLLVQFSFTCFVWVSIWMWFHVVLCGSHLFNAQKMISWRSRMIFFISQYCFFPCFKFSPSSFWKFSKCCRNRVTKCHSFFTVSSLSHNTCVSLAVSSLYMFSSSAPFRIGSLELVVVVVLLEDVDVASTVTRPWPFGPFGRTGAAETSRYLRYLCKTWIDMEDLFYLISIVFSLLMDT